MPNWNMWIGDESAGSKIYFKGSDQPQEIPLPKKKWRGSIHPTITPGVSKVQSMGYEPAEFRFNLLVSYSVYVALDALLSRMSGNQHLSCQFNNSYATYLCKPIGDIDPKMPNRRDGKVVFPVALLVESIVT